MASALVPTSRSLPWVPALIFLVNWIVVETSKSNKHLLPHVALVMIFLQHQKNKDNRAVFMVRTSLLALLLLDSIGFGILFSFLLISRYFKISLWLLWFMGCLLVINVEFDYTYWRIREKEFSVYETYNLWSKMFASLLYIYTLEKFAI